MMPFPVEPLELAEKTRKFIAKTKPYLRPPKNRTKTYEQYEFTKELYDLRDGPKINSTTVSRHCSLKRLEQLEPIRLKDMFVNKHHVGKYLRCRVCEKPVMMTSVMLLVEDEDGEIENVNLYNFTTDYNVDLNDVLPANSVIAIKEPLLQTMMQDHKNFFIRVESPTDLVVLDEHDVEKWKRNEHERTHEQLNELGNKCFATKQYRQAIRFYNKAIKKSKTAKTYSNRAAAHLELEMFHEAFLDAQESARIQSNEKAYYRMGRAAYSMRQFADAVNYFRQCLKLNEKNESARKELLRSEERVKESETGEYDMKQLASEVKAGKLRLDVADYMSKSIRIENDVERKEKSLVAIEDIKRGTLLIASKAATIVYQTECDVQVMSLDCYTHTYNPPAYNYNLSRLYYKIQHDPHLAKQVYKLKAGPDVGPCEEIPEGIVDSVRAERVLTYCSFQSEDLRKAARSFLADIPNDPSEDYNNGLWIVPSFVNHACIPNTQKLYLNDFVTYYALVDIKKGQMLTADFFGIHDYETRKKKRDSYGVKCECALCKLELSDPNYKKRQTLLARCDKIVPKKANWSENYLKSYLSTLKDTYRPGQPYQYQLFPALSHIATWYILKSDMEKHAQVVLQMFESKKDCDYVSAAVFIVEAARNYVQARMRAKAREVLAMARAYLVGHIEHYNYAFDLDKLEESLASF